MPATPVNWEAVKAIVADALELPAAERESLLQTACNGDGSLLVEARSLVAAYEQADGVIDSRTDAWLGLGGPDLLSLGGQKIGRYTLQKLLAEGAMAAVYVAKQNNPHRDVALKLVRFNMPMIDAAVRFKREAQALGRLQHPNIARIYEAGVHQQAGGAAMPFIAMEYVDGPPLNIFARDRKLSRTQRIELMIKVASAVHAAHQQAIIHRDLKPANVLVDSTGEPKVLDFGIARIIGADDQESLTWQTTAGVLLGTPGYMSPEQAAGNASEIDVRSDVWALGVLLHELLTGRLPIEVKNTSIVEVLKLIETTEPAPISKFDRTLRGDLETIVMTALAREKVRRYPSAQAMADDLKRVLDYEPITARAPTRWYRTQKFIRRHRIGLGATAAVMSLLIATSVISWFAYQRAEAARARAQSINTFLLEMMSTTDPNVGSKDMTVVQALTGSDRLIAKNFADDPQSEAEVRSTIGWTFYNLGLYDPAVAQLQKAVELRKTLNGPSAVETIDATTRLVTSMRWQYRQDGAALKLAEESYQLATEKLGEKHPSTIAMLDNFAGAMDDAGRYAEAEPLLRRAVDLNNEMIGPKDQQTLTAMNNHAVVLINLGRWAEAEKVLREVVARRNVNDQGARVPYITNRHNLCVVITNQGRFEDAVAEFEKTIAAAKNLLGEDHSRTLSAMVSYADALLGAGRGEEALAVNRRVLERRQTLLGPQHEQTLSSTHNVINVMLGVKMFADAESLSRQLIAQVDQFTAVDNALRIIARQDLGLSLAGLKKYDEAEVVLRQVIEQYQKKYGDINHPRALIQRNNRANVLMEMGRTDEALNMLQELGAALEKKPLPMILPGYHRNLGRTLLKLHRYADAEVELVKALEASETTGNKPAAADNAGYLVTLYQQWQKPELAEKYQAMEKSLRPAANLAPASQPIGE